MRRLHVVLLYAVVCFGVSSSVSAQTRKDWLNAPLIVDIFQPVVGNGGLYQTQSEQNKARNQTKEMTVVGKETFEGKEAYWIEIGHTDEKNGAMSYGKILITKDDLIWRRIISQQSGQQPTEIDLHPEARKKSNQELENWRKVGSESITVPAGTFVCDHWTKGKGYDIWVNPKISPFSTVKEVDLNSTTVLVKVITDATDHITGTPKKFDPEEMKRQMMEQMRKQQKP